MFVDYAVVKVKAGGGGHGIISFRREKHVPMGGPDGGNGGNGGDVILRVDSQLSTLQDVKYRKSYKAKRGAHGSGANKTGRGGDTVIIPVPPGTVVRDKETGELLCDLSEAGDEFIAAKGGRGGRGNAAFVTSTHRAPHEAEDGVPGEERTLELELKILADVGIVGLPNAGKSTLLSRVSAARPKIADYPFTTLEPVLGIVSAGDYSSFVMADIPGLISGAHKGKGLGDRFLKHIERTKLLLYLIDCLDDSPVRSYNELLSEIKQYGAGLEQKPAVIALNKMDSATDKGSLDELKLEGNKPHLISAVTGEGVSELIARIWDELQQISG